MKKFILLFFLLAKMASAEEWSDIDSLDRMELESAPMGVVKMQAEFLDSDLLKIEVLVSDMLTPVLGSAFHLKFPFEDLAFLRYEPGEFLENGGDPFYLVKAEGSEVVFGETLRRDDNFPLGSGVLVSFYFQILEEKGFSFEFDRGVVSTLDSVRQDLDNIVFEDLFVERVERVFSLPAANNISFDSTRWIKLFGLLMGSFGTAVLFIMVIKRRFLIVK
ncbi:hypothetical protein JKY72_05235 [Candidatus Gracilibacteria bacterium]|nr:hypothetical protein [Candidatus Gracilibacteria bacterium]